MAVVKLAHHTLFRPGRDKSWHLEDGKHRHYACTSVTPVFKLYQQAASMGAPAACGYENISLMVHGEKSLARCGLEPTKLTTSFKLLLFSRLFS